MLFSKIVGCFYRIKLMFLRATYWSSGSQAKREINGAASFLIIPYFVVSSLIKSMFLIKTFTADNKTAGLLCESLGRILSAIYSASSESLASWVEIASRIKIWPHSLASLTAARILFKFPFLPNLRWFLLDEFEISKSDAHALATTIALPSWRRP